MNFSTIFSPNLEIHWEHTANAPQTTHNSHSPRNKHTAENLQWSHINMRMTTTWGINEVVKLLSTLPSIVMTKMKERGKEEHHYICTMVLLRIWRSVSSSLHEKPRCRIWWLQVICSRYCGVLRFFLSLIILMIKKVLCPWASMRCDSSSVQTWWDRQCWRIQLSINSNWMNIHS